MADRAQAEQTTAALLLNWRQPGLTQDCLRDLTSNWPVGLRLLVIDNGSGDDSAEQLQRAVEAAREQGFAVEFLGLEENLGFAGGMNRGIDWAGSINADYVLVLNNDLQLPEGFLPPLVAVLRDAERVVAVAPTVVFPDGRVWAQGGSLGFSANALKLNGHGQQPAPTEHGPEVVDFVPGACVLYRRSDLQEVGGFDETYFMYWEDADLCRRLAEGGGVVVWLPWVRITHLGGASAGGSRSPLRKFLMAKNCVRYLAAHGSFGQWAAFVLLDLLLLPLALLRSPRAGWAKLRGVLSGLRGRPATASDVARWHRG